MQKIRLRGATKIAVHETTRRYPEVAASIGISIALIAFAILLAAAATLYHYVEEDYKVDLLTADDLKGR